MNRPTIRETLSSENWVFLTYDSSGRVRWHTLDERRFVVLVYPEPIVSEVLVREFIKATEGYDPGSFESDERAMAYSTVNDD